MKNPKIVLLGDLHFGIRKHSEIFANYFNKFFEEVFFPYLEENDIKHVIQLGDLIDSRKYINGKTVDQVHNKYFKQFEDREIHLWQMVGNHDVYYKNTNSINWIRSLLERSNYEYVHFLEDPTTININNCDIDIIPWINDTNSDDIFQFIEESNSKYLCGHLELAGFEVVKGHEMQHGHLASQFKKYKKVFTGHYHIRSEKGNVVYTGIPYEMTFADADDPKGFYLFDTTNGKYEFVRHTDKLFYKIEYTDKFKVKGHKFKKYENSYVKVVIKERQDQENYDAFLTRLSSVNVFDLSIVDASHQVNQDIDLDSIEMEDTLTILQKFIDKNVGKSYNKKNIRTHVDELYQEAQVLMKDTA